MTGTFTGRHAAAIFIAFFGVVIAVNVTMAVLAARTFGGTVVDNSYVASQQFNGWIAEGRRDAASGWAARVVPGEQGRVSLSLTRGGAALDRVTLAGIARHPLGRLPDQPLRFVAMGNGIYESTDPLPAGRWQLRLDGRGDDGVIVHLLVPIG
jgi:nitrogen fixation protein FixH